MAKKDKKEQERRERADQQVERGKKNLVLEVEKLNIGRKRRGIFPFPLPWSK